MKRIQFLNFSISLCLLVSLTGCTTKTQRQYQKIRAGDISGQELYHLIQEFDETHSDFVSSKLDLAVYHLVSGNYSKSHSYLEKCEKLINGGSAISNDEKALLFASLSAVNLIDSKIDEAWEYAKKSYGIPKSGKRYGFLCGRILVAMEKEDEAKKYFDECYSLFPDAIDAESARAYMYLLAKNEDYDKARKILEIYIDKGTFFSGLGLFASGVYEKCGDLEKSIYSAFLDYEYHSCFGHGDDGQFAANLNTLEEKYRENGISMDEKAKNAIKQLKSLYSQSLIASPASDFYVSQYVHLREKIRCRTFDFDDYKSFISLEKYFNQFPCYYWILMNLVPQFETSNVDALVLTLCEKIISLAPSSVFTPSCRALIGKSQGLSEAESGKLRISEEIQNAVYMFVQTGQTKYLDEVYDFLSLPDCTYVYDGVMLLKGFMDNKFLFDEFASKEKNEKGRLKERLAFILS